MYRSRSILRLSLSVLTGSAAMALCAPAQAQTNAEQQAPSAGQADVGEIVVMAQRRSEKLQDVPISVLAFGEDRLTANSITSTADLNVLTPGLNAISASGYFLPHLRGVGTSAGAASLENPIATYVDGVYLGQQVGSVLALKSVEQVEVDRGPQGTLFGRNATGGLIQVKTRDPSAQFAGEVTAGYGNYNTADLNLYVTGGVTANASADLAFYVSHQGDGYGTNLFNGEPSGRDRTVAARSKWLFTPSDGTRITLTGDYTRRTGFSYLYPLPGTTSLGGSAALKPFDLDVAGSAHEFSEQGGGSITIEHEFASMTLTSTSAYRAGRYDTSYPSSTSNPATSSIPATYDRGQQASEELQLASSKSSPVKWVGGLYLYWASAGFRPLDISGGLLGPLDIQISDTQRTYSGAVYGQVTVPVTSTTNVTGGLRYTIDTKRWKGFESFSGIPIPGFGDSDSKTYRKLTWRFSIDQKFSDTVMAYASANRGFKSGGFNDSSVPAAAYRPETLDAYEVGIKAQTSDRHVTFNPAFFYYSYENLQVVRYVGGNQELYNGASAELYGLDLDAQVVVTRNLRLSGGLELIHDKYKSFPNADLTTPAPGGGNVFSQTDASGNRIAFVSRTSGNIGVDHHLPLSFGAIDTNVTFSYTSSWFAAPDNRLKQNGYGLLNATIKWTSPDKRYELALWGKNLTDRIYARDIGSRSYDDFIQYGPPRTFGARATVKW